MFNSHRPCKELRIASILFPSPLSGNESCQALCQVDFFSRLITGESVISRDRLESGCVSCDEDNRDYSRQLRLQPEHIFMNVNPSGKGTHGIFVLLYTFKLR